MTIMSFDIDGVLARRNTRNYIAVCMQELHIALAQEEMERISYQAFLKHPAVLSYEGRVGVQAAHRALAWMYYHPQVLLEAKTMRGAQEGVRMCQQIAEICYCTARYSLRHDWNTGMQISTTKWLATKQFPNPNQVLFCKSYQDKMEQLAQRSQQQESYLLHIDDSWHKLLQVTSAMPPQFVLVAFGAQSEDIPPSSVRSIALPSWNHLDCTLDQLRKEGFL